MRSSSASVRSMRDSTARPSYPALTFSMVTIGGLSRLLIGGHLNGCTVSSRIAAIGSILAAS